MTRLQFPPAILISILTFICVLIAVPASLGDDDKQYTACSRPYNYKCGPLSVNISYPFWQDGIRPRYCGRHEFELKCEHNEYLTLQIGDQDFQVLGINETHQIMKIARADFWPDLCSQIFPETYINRHLYSYGENVGNLSIFYECKGDLSSQLGKNKFSCRRDDGEFINAFYTIDNHDESQLRNLSDSCSSVIKVPFQNTSENVHNLWEGKLNEVMDKGYEVRYQADNMLCSACNSSKGICGSDRDLNEFSCLCRDQPQPRTCSLPGEVPIEAPSGTKSPENKNHTYTENKNTLRAKLYIGFGAAVGGMGIMIAAFFIYKCYKRYKKSHSTIFSRNTSSDPFSKSDLEKGDNFLGVHVFSYAELEEATNNFDSARELGEGGFGTVYYGELQDGRGVAVKRLYENNYKRVEQFMNEVEILARLRHQNLVSLYGCTSRHSRELLLVYEYIPNGTVADHLHGEQAKPGAVPWPTRLKIAIETANALTYLHASDIIHRDVKTNNILLDSNFCVKVADFGLSRLFPTHVTHVSTAPQGTPGYVDPEYHQCYQLTDKSDVFSFGVVLIELISSMPAVDITRHRYEINLSNLAINKIQKKALHELVDPTLGYESDSKVRKTINAVAELAFRSLQSEKELRPFMMDVLETLKDIASDGYNTKKTEGMLSQSLDSVSHNWTSTKTTPNSL